MTTQDLINTLRQGAPVTARQVKAIVSQLERIPAMERVIAAKDRDFTQLSIAYTAAIETGKAHGVQFTSDECGYVCDALEECERLKNAVTWMLETMDTKHQVVSYTSGKSASRGMNGAGSLGDIREHARKAVEELIYGS